MLTIFGWSLTHKKKNRKCWALDQCQKFQWVHHLNANSYLSWRLNTAYAYFTGCAPLLLLQNASCIARNTQPWPKTCKWTFQFKLGYAKILPIAEIKAHALSLLWSRLKNAMRVKKKKRNACSLCPKSQALLKSPVPFDEEQHRLSFLQHKFAEHH